MEIDSTSSNFAKYDFFQVPKIVHTSLFSILLEFDPIPSKPFYSKLIKIILYNYRKRRKGFARKRLKRRPRRLKRKRNVSKKQKLRDKK